MRLPCEPTVNTNQGLVAQETGTGGSEDHELNGPLEILIVCIRGYSCVLIIW